MAARITLFFFSLFMVCGAYAQNPPIIVQRGAPSVIVNDARGKFSLSLEIPVVNDTISALNGGPDSLGLVVQVRSTGYWYKRDTVTGGHFWNLIGTGAGSPGTWGSLTGTLSSQIDLYDSLNARQRALGFIPIGPADTANMLANYLRLAVAQALFYPLSSNPAGYITSNGLPNVVNSLQVINTGGADSWAAGVYASRPTAGIARRFYLATDSLKIYYDNGSIWLTVAGGGGGGGGTVSWGAISGTLSTQTDLQNALNLKLSAASNLSDLNNAGSARTNLGLGNVQNVDQTNASNLSSGTVPNARIDTASTISSKAFAETILADTAAAIRARTFGLHLQKQGTRGIMPLWGHDSTLLAKGIVDSGSTHLFLNPDSTITIYSNDSALMAFNRSGNRVTPISNNDSLSIGTATPVAPLTVQGTGYFKVFNFTPGSTNAMAGIVSQLTQDALANGQNLNGVAFNGLIGAAAGDTLNSAIYFQADVLNPTGHINNEVGVNIVGGTLGNVNNYTGLQLADGTVASGGTYTGIASFINSGTGKHPLALGGTAESYTMGPWDIGNNTGGYPSAAFSVTSTSQGVLLSPMTYAQIIAISSPADGLTAYAKDSAYYYAYNLATTTWKKVGGSSSSSNLVPLAAVGQGVAPIYRGSTPIDTLYYKAIRMFVTNADSSIEPDTNQIVTPTNMAAYVAAHGGGGGISSVTNSDGTLAFNTTSGAVVGSLALGHANTWTGAQTIQTPILVGSSVAGNVWTANNTSGAGQWSALPITNVTATNTTLTLTGGGTSNVALALNLSNANTWTATQTIQTPVLGTSSTVGYVWTATNTSGAGGWQASSGGGLADPGSNGIIKRTSLNTTAIAIASDYPTLNQNTTGSAASLSAASALPSGTTATTQTSGDNSTKVATTAYVNSAVTSGASTVVFSETASGSAVTNTTSTTSIIGTGTGSMTIPANTLTAGKTIVFHGWVQVSTTTGTQPIDLFFMNGGFGDAIQINLPGGLSGELMELTETVTILTTGTSGTYAVYGTLRDNGTFYVKTADNFGVHLDTTISQAITQQAQWTNASSGNSIQLMPLFTMKVE